MAKLIPAHTLAAIPPSNATAVTGKAFFPHLISAPFMSGLRIAFSFSLILFLIAALASWLRGNDEPAARHSQPDEVLEARAEAVEAEVLTA